MGALKLFVAAVRGNGSSNSTIEPDELKSGYPIRSMGLSSGAGRYSLPEGWSPRILLGNS